MKPETPMPFPMNAYVDDRIAEGVFRVHGAAYTDAEVFELEQTHIFEKTWVFLGHESQIPKPLDRLSTMIGRRPVLLMRNAAGKLGAFFNACRHKGALLTRVEKSSGRYLVCPYHGWAYDSEGRNIDIKDRKAGGYGAGFDADSHDLLPLPRLGVYKGLIFGSASAQVPPLEDFLGEMRVFLDIAMEQSPAGMELIPGRIAFRYRGNWKLQLDNGTDFYHLTSTHAGFMDLVARRAAERAGNQEGRQYDWQKRLAQEGGTFHFEHGHAVVWLNQAEVEKRPIWPSIPEIARRVGQARADWMLKLRGVSVFPNMQIADGTSLTLRVFRPLAADLTELRYYCIGPVGEAPELRAGRLRQFEDFFNVSGFATPDDAVLYEDCQRGFDAGRDWLQGHARGLAVFRPLAADLTELRYYCIGPVGEAPELRAARLRQFEDFFNVSGFATPDDAVLYEDCQRGFEAGRDWLQGHARGLAEIRPGGNKASDQLGFTPVSSVIGGFELQNETTLHPPYREWARLLRAGLEGRGAYE